MDKNVFFRHARDTPVDQLLAWFNREVPRCLRSLSLFDPEGLLIGDASYLFVPDNEHYEQSDVHWFDEHNHPVEADQVDLRDKRYLQHRCYKLVSLIHVNRKLDFFFTVAARVVSGRRHECPILYELVEEMAGAVHKDFIKVLIVDRGLIDGGRMGHLKQKWGIALRWACDTTWASLVLLRDQANHELALQAGFTFPKACNDASRDHWFIDIGHSHPAGAASRDQRISRSRTARPSGDQCRGCSFCLQYRLSSQHLAPNNNRPPLSISI